jgi:hypothetical protein
MVGSDSPFWATTFPSTETVNSPRFPLTMCSSTPGSFPKAAAKLAACSRIVPQTGHSRITTFFIADAPFVCPRRTCRLVKGIVDGDDWFASWSRFRRPRPSVRRRCERPRWLIGVFSVGYRREPSSGDEQRPDVMAAVTGWDRQEHSRMSHVIAHIPFRLAE